MTEKLLLVTAPDDTLENGVRIAVVGLSSEQGSLVSQSLGELETPPCVVTYVWNENDPIEWLIDKLYKSEIVLFNAEIENQTLAGYLASKSNAYYFGTLRSLTIVNTSAIHDLNQCKTILERTFEKYGK
jgi:hypothetical protein